MVNSTVDDMKIIILNGPMGVGKTTIGTHIADKYPGTAFIDGDWCMDIHPFVGNSETKAMAVDNILHMVKNYNKSSYCDMVVISWLMDDSGVFASLIKGLAEMDADITSVTLMCSEEQLRKQWNDDKTCPWRTDEWLNVSIKFLKCFEQFENCIDTTGLSVEEVVERIMS